MNDPPDPISKELTLIALSGLPEIKQGDDIASEIFKAQKKLAIDFEDGDIYVIAQKVVSKAEGRVAKINSIAPSVFSSEFAKFLSKDPREVELILRESKSVVRARRGILITETKRGIVCANAGIDRSNVMGDDSALLLPENPDRSALKIRKRLEKLTGKMLAVIISDTFGRPWREGQVDFAIGVSGISCFRDYRGKRDMYDRVLRVTRIAQVDEIAAAAELLMGKARSIPVVLMKGYSFEREDGSKKLLRRITRDLFR
ncbi:MAG: coenzyme F420-0:L-glutamate ligase [Nitrososphaerota archaeon]